MRREEESVCRRVMNMEVPGKRKRGRPRKRWKDSIKEDMLEKNVQVDDTQTEVGGEGLQGAATPYRNGKS